MKRNPYVRPTQVVIDLEKLKSNWHELRKLMPKETKVLAIAKANGYGHGSVEITKAFANLGAAGVGVADLSEAIVLREAGYRGLVMCLGTVPSQGLREAAEYDVVTAVHSIETLEDKKAFLEKENFDTLRVHLKVDTGMHRLGFNASEWESLAQILKKETRIQVEGIFTHFAESDSPNREFTTSQLAQFQDAIELFEKHLQKRLIRHAANSGGILNHPQAHLDWVRPGIVLYGYPPTKDPSLQARFHPILSWKAPITQLKNIAPGDSVSYNRNFRADRPMKIATLPVGYGDGYRRSYAKAGVGFRGKRCRVLGAVCMDLMMIDVTDVPGVQVGEEAHLLDDGTHGGPNADELAKFGNTIPYDVLCAVSARVSRTYVGNVA